MKLTNYLYIVLLFAFLPKIKAQHELSLHFMDTIFQSSFTNPAFHAGIGKTTAMLPSFYGNFISPYSASQLTVDVEGKKTINFKSAFKAMGTDNRFFTNSEVQTMGLSLGFNRMNVSFYHKLKAESYANIAKDLIGGFAYGNQPYLGKTMDLGSSFNGQMYSEMGLGLSYCFNEKISIGGRVKRLAGFASVATVKNGLTLLTDSTDYKLTFNTDFDVRTYDIDRFEAIQNGTFAFTDILKSDNTGFSFDLGASAVFNKLKISASVIDLAGGINWKNGAKTYSSKGTYEYLGVKSDKFLSFDGVNTKEMQDTIKEALNIQEGKTGETTIKLPMKTYFSASYDLNNTIKLGGLVYMETWGGVSKTDFMLSSTFKLAKQVHLGATYSLRSSTYNNLGVNFVFNLKALQIYGLTDNVLSLANNATAKSVNARLGINLMFN